MILNNCTGTRQEEKPLSAFGSVIGDCVTHLDVTVHHSVCCVLPSAGTPPEALARPGRPLHAHGSFHAARCTTVSHADQRRSANPLVAPVGVRNVRVDSPAGTQRGIMGVVGVLLGRGPAGALLRGGGGGTRVAAQAAVLGALQHPEVLAGWETPLVLTTVWDHVGESTLKSRRRRRDGKISK